MRAQGLEPWTYGLKERCQSDGTSGEATACDDDGPCVVPFVANLPGRNEQEELTTAEKLAALCELLPNVDDDTLRALLQQNSDPGSESPGQAEGEA